MALKAVLDNLESVDDALRPFYKELDKKFVLDVDGVDDHPGVRALKNAYETTKAERAEARAKLGEYETKIRELPQDFDAAKWHEWKVAAEEGKQKKDERVEEITRLHEARLEALKTQFASEKTELERSLGSLNGELDSMVRDNELTDLLIKARVAEDFLPAAKLLVGQKVKTQLDGNGRRQNLVETNIGPMPLKDFIPTWAASDGKPYIAKGTGVDAPGGSRMGGGKTITRADFDRLGSAQKAEAAGKMAKGEIQIVD